MANGLNDELLTDPNFETANNDEAFDDDTLYARRAEIKTFEDLKEQRGTSIPALFNQLYKFIQNPSSVSVETYKRMVDTDDTIGSGVDFLTTCLAARIGRYIHPSKEITQFVNKALDEVEGGFTGLIKELLSSTWAGVAVGEIVWANKPLGFVPQKVVVLPPTTILFETERTGELTPDGILQYQRNYNPYFGTNSFGGLGSAGGVGLGFMGGGADRPDAFAKFGDLPYPMRTANSFTYLSIRIPRQKCIHYPFNAQGVFGNPYGRSLLRRAYKYYVMKDAILQMQMIALDRKGTPLTVIFADPNAMMEDGSQDDGSGPQGFRGQKGKGIRADEAAKRAFKNVHNDSTIVLPGKKNEIYEIEVIPQASNVSDFIASADFCNKSMLRALLLPSLIFGNGDGSGSFALGQEHAKTFDKICDSTNASLENVLLQDLIKQIIAYNFPKSAWQKDGLGAFSKKTLSRDEIQKEMEVYVSGIESGVIDQADLNDLNKMRDTIGFEPVEKIIEKPMPTIGGIPGEDGGDPEGDDESSKEDSEKGKKEAPKEKEADKAKGVPTSKAKASRFREIVARLARLFGIGEQS